MGSAKHVPSPLLPEHVKETGLPAPFLFRVLRRHLVRVLFGVAYTSATGVLLSRRSLQLVLEFDRSAQTDKMPDITLFSVNAILILCPSDGSRVLAK